jgi:DNA polymerase III epsilon subunit-like protein
MRYGQLAPCVAEPTDSMIVPIPGVRMIKEVPEMGWVKKKSKKEEFDGRNYPDIMVDLETMGTDTDSQVLSIGAVRFRLDVLDDIETVLEPERNFYARLDLASQRECGRTEDPDTATWWAEQSAEARGVFEEEEEPTKDALKRFLKFCKGGKRVWGNGNMFDNAIVRSLCKDYDLTYPVGYWRDLDVRTLTYLWNLLTNWGSKGKRPEIILGEEHNALDDARRQVLQCQLMYKDIRGSKYGPESAE